VTLGSLGAHDDRPAIVEPGRGAISYATLDRLADRVAARLRRLGAGGGARIGLYTRRSSDAIALMLGTLRAGCAYVPVDPRAPVERNVTICVNCDVHATLVEERFATAFRNAVHRAGADEIDIQTLQPVGLGHAVRAWAPDEVGPDSGHQTQGPSSPSADLASILYTSGSTGRPKGWMMSRKAVEFHAQWARAHLAVSRSDVLANHAQFNFGMSLFDIYTSLSSGATLVLVPDEIRADAARVADLLAHERVTIWYSGPAILSRLGQLDGLKMRDLGSLRVVAFAGEAFPPAKLRALRARLPHPRYFNFYGSTEANIAAFYELPDTLDGDGPLPMGRPCDHYQVRVVDEDGVRVLPGTPGELQLRGGGLDTGYWGDPELTARQLIADPGVGQPWFRTGDRVVALPNGDLRHCGRVDRMVKLRGYRVEPGEIEARLYEHPRVREVGVVPADGSEGLELVAHLSTSPGERLSIVELKEFCSAKLPPYMIPARFAFHEALPRTSTGKIDIQTLRESP
jgi:amino acid adenylation domain-containing protein